LRRLCRVSGATESEALIGEFAAYREIASGELATVPIDHPLFSGAHARVLVKTGRPPAPTPLELRLWIRHPMRMFSASKANAGSKRKR
jgi:hypothetical protein